MAQQDFTQKCEDYWLDRLPETERQALETELASDSELQADLAAYGQLFQGFSAIQEEEISTKLQDWNAEWIDRDDTELIEAYLLGHLNENAVKEFETRIQQDTSFAKSVAQQREIAKSLDAARSEDFSEKLQKWSQQSMDQKEEDKEEEDVKPIRRVGIVPMRWRKLAAAAAVLLVLVVALQLVMKPSYTDAALATTAYEAPRSGTTMGATEPNSEEAFLQEFKKAHRLLSQGDFGAADAAFKRLQQQLIAIEMDAFSKTYLQDNLSWNELLAQLGSNKTDADFMTRLEGIAANTDHTYQKEAKSLLRKLNSAWRWF